MIDRSFAEAKKLLDVIESSRVNGNSVGEFLTVNGWNYWQVLRYGLLIELKHLDLSALTAPHIRYNFKDAIFSSLVFGYSLISLLYITFRTMLSKQRPVAVYTTDTVVGELRCDQRIRPLYESLNTLQRPYVEFIHFVPGKKSLRNLPLRRRPAIYIESMDFILSYLVRGRGIGVAVADAKQVTWVEHIITKCELISQLRLKRQRWIDFCVRVVSPAQCMLIDDMRSFHELIVACRNAHVPTTAIQHGHITKYHIGWLSAKGNSGNEIKANRLLMWSNYWRDELMALGTYFTPQELVIGGLKNSLRQEEALDGGIKVPIRLMLVYESEAPFDEIAPFVRAILAQPDFQLHFKARPDVEVSLQLRPYGLTKENCIIQTDTKESCGKVDMAIGTYSTVLYEYIEMGLPVGVLSTSSDFGEAMVRNHLADSINLGDLTFARIEEILVLARKQVPERRLKLTSPDKQMRETLTQVL